ncbi:MAG: hypothetical protein JW730_09175 [Anaerolineales bacterium]|nr:hypothetical protein [Anaerolineales bacterium]
MSLPIRRRVGELLGGKIAIPAVEYFKPGGQFIEMIEDFGVAIDVLVL